MKINNKLIDKTDFIKNSQSNSTEDTYSANYQNDFNAIDISDAFTTTYTLNQKCALYFPKSKIVIVSFNVQGLPGTGTPTILSTTDYKPASATYNTAYGSAGSTLSIGALTTGAISRVAGSTSLVSGMIMYKTS